MVWLIRAFQHRHAHSYSWSHLCCDGRLQVLKPRVFFKMSTSLWIWIVGAKVSPSELADQVSFQKF